MFELPVYLRGAFVTNEIRFRRHLDETLIFSYKYGMEVHVACLAAAMVREFPIKHLALVGLVVGVFIGLFMINKYLKNKFFQKINKTIFTIDELGQMRNTGQISDQEYKILREKLLQEIL